MKKKIAFILAIIMMISIIPNVSAGKAAHVYADEPKTGANAVAKARSYVGAVPYVYGGTDLATGCDCSGFVCAIYNLLGMDFIGAGVRSSYDMRDSFANIHATKLTTTDISAVRDGDLVITNGGDHVGIGTSAGTMIHETNPTTNCVQEISLATYTTSSSAIVAIIRIDFTQWGGTNAEDAGTDVVPADSGTTNVPTDVAVEDNPGAPYAVPAGPIQNGTRGDAARWLQTALNAVNNAGLSVDGVVGALSTAAISSFQSANGLTANGVADATTISKIVEVYKNNKAGQALPLPDRKLSNEWFNGQWYGADGNTDYKYKGSWQSNGVGIWFQDQSGWYPKSCWQFIDGKWFYFDASGYAYRNGWYMVGGMWYYFKNNGEIAENEWIYGYWLSSGGYWTYTAYGQWKSNSTGWWFEDSYGWYPKNESVKIDGVVYRFDASGYWIP